MNTPNASETTRRGRRRRLADLPGWGALLESVERAAGAAPIVRYARVTYPDTARDWTARNALTSARAIACMGGDVLGDALGPCLDLPPPVRAAWADGATRFRVRVLRGEGVTVVDVLWAARTTDGADRVVRRLADAGALLFALADRPRDVAGIDPAMDWCSMFLVARAARRPREGFVVWGRDIPDGAYAALDRAPTDRPSCVLVEDVLDATVRAIRAPGSVLDATATRGGRPIDSGSAQTRFYEWVMRLRAPTPDREVLARLRIRKPALGAMIGRAKKRAAGDGLTFPVWVDPEGCRWFGPTHRQGR